MKLGIMDFLDTKGMSEEDVKKFEGIDEAFGKAVSEFLKGATDIAEFKESLDGLKISMDSFKEENASKAIDKNAFDGKINEIEESILRMKAAFEKTGKGGQLKVKSLEDQIAEQLKEFVKDDENGRKTVNLKEACLTSAGHKKDIDLVIDTKAVGVVTSTGVAPSYGNTIDNTLSVDPRALTVIRSVANVASTTDRALTYAEFKPGEGEAKWTPEGSIKPNMDGTISEVTIKSGKIALTATLTEETLSDLPQLVAEIRAEIINRIAIAEEKGILNGTGTDGSIKGVKADMPSFSLTGVEVEKANMYDAIVAAYTQVVSTSNMSYRPNLIIMNPLDYAKMQLTKDVNGQYLRPFKSGDELIPGLTVMPTTAVDPGEFTVGDFSYLNIRDVWALSIRFGWVNDDFKKNQVQMLGEKRLMAYIKAQYKTAFVADKFKTVIEAIAPTAP